MTDFERIEQAIAEQNRELQRLESEIQEKRQMLDRQKQYGTNAEPEQWNPCSGLLGTVRRALES